MEAISAKPLQLNPIKLSQPMGAMLCFLGIKNCMPLMHGAQGCASFSKVFFTRHFKFTLNSWNLNFFYIIMF